MVSVCGTEGSITKEHVPQLPYLDRFIKESMRLFPVSIVLGRHCIADLDLGKFVFSLVRLDQYTLAK